MTVIKINALTVPAEMGDEVARRFGARAGAVDGADGFEGFELLRPEDDRNTWLVLTRWRDDEAFEAWRNSGSAEEAHRAPPSDPGGESAGPMGLSAELWSYSIEVSSDGTTQ
ncbi:MAG: antibiotic biosynthesis monooxygenase family protein [Acidimicrobiales bacterium]